LREIAAAIRTGQSVVGAFKVTAEAASEPTHTEFLRVLTEVDLGTPLDEALQPVAVRMATEDVSHVALIVALHRRSGGNVAETLERIAESVSERTELRREMRALTAQARLSRWVVTALPPSIVTIVALLNPHYLSPLVHTSGGLTLMVIATMMVIAGSAVMRGIVDIRV
jgi:tight adherence protein B